MKIALIGASGFVGKVLLDELAQRGHQVTAISRHPNKIQPAPNVTAVEADVLDESAVTDVVKGNDAVVSAYNPGWTNPNIYNEFLKGSKAIQEGVRKSGVKRLLIIGGAGSLFVAPGLQLIDSPEFPTAYKNGAGGARDYLNILKEETELEWTFLSPAIEMHRGTSSLRKGAYRTGKDEPVFNEAGKSQIAVEDLALAIADELENPKHIRQRFTVGY